MYIYIYIYIYAYISISIYAYIYLSIYLYQNDAYTHTARLNDELLRDSKKFLRQGLPLTCERTQSASWSERCLGFILLARVWLFVGWYFLRF